MNSRQLASILNGRSYLEEMNREERDHAKRAGLVVAYGFGEKHVELRGAIDLELEGTTFWVNALGHASTSEGLAEGRLISASREDGCWHFETDLPHETFQVFDGKQLASVGIVFSLSDLARQSTTTQQSLSQGAGYLRLCANLLLQMAEERGLDLGDEAAVMTLQVDGREQTAPLTYVIGRMNALARELSAMAEGRLA